MRPRLLSTILLLLSAGATILAGSGPPTDPHPWEISESLNPLDLFYGATHQAPKLREHQQALVMTALAFDQASLQAEFKPELTAMDELPFWPVDREGQYWEAVTNAAGPSGRSFITMGAYPRMWLPISSHLVDTRHFSVMFDDAETVSDSFLPTLPEIVREARSLLRPAQVWELTHDDPLGGMRNIYRDLQLAPNPRYLGGLERSFDRVEFFFGNHDNHRQYMLLLTLGEQAWLWTAGEAMNTPNGGFPMVLYRDAQALEMTRGNSDYKPRSMGTLSDLATMIDEPMRLAWINASGRVSVEQRRSALENRARLTLRALGSSQLAYQEQNRMGNFASYDNMVETDYIQRGYTRRNFINSYSLSVFYARPARRDDQGLSIHDSAFTIVAMPRNSLIGLRTFSICDDQIIRVATDFNLNIVGNHGNSVPTGDNPCTWEPLR